MALILPLIAPSVAAAEDSAEVVAAISNGVQKDQDREFSVACLGNELSEKRVGNYTIIDGSSVLLIAFERKGEERAKETVVYADWMKDGSLDRVLVVPGSLPDSLDDLICESVRPFEEIRLMIDVNNLSGNHEASNAKVTCINHQTQQVKLVSHADGGAIFDLPYDNVRADIAAFREAASKVAGKIR
ncbi:MAG: hypothetical protein V1495_09275 [Pseudomonadota bacterium]